MKLFESLVAILLAALLLLALALFIAPALLHAAYHTSPRGLRRYWFPLLALAVFAVLVTTAAVTLVGMRLGGLTFAAAFALGAIVAPPDAAASEAVLSEVGLPRRGQFILAGESLLNDATALLLFGFATMMATRDETAGGWAMLLAAEPAGIVFGATTAWLYLRVSRLFAGTLGASIADFAVTFAIWLVAERLHLSPVLAIVTFGMVVARWRPVDQPARDRVQASAVWSAAVLVLNVVAFLLMGLQSREVLTGLAPAERWPAIGFALGVLLTVIVVRLLWVLGVRLVEGVVARRFGPAWLPRPPSWRDSFIVSWTGMRGLLTLATAFALPHDIPGRNLIVLAAFTVVIGTLVIQGLTLGPLIRWLAVGGDDNLLDKIASARRDLIDAGLEAIGDEHSDAARALRARFGAAGDVVEHADDPQAPSAFDQLHLRVLARQRKRLHELRDRGEVAEDIYRRLQEELDWSEVEAQSFSDNILRAT